MTVRNSDGFHEREPVKMDNLTQRTKHKTFSQLEMNK